jgi:hypothetical protein
MATPRQKDLLMSTDIHPVDQIFGILAAPFISRLLPLFGTRVEPAYDERVRRTPALSSPDTSHSSTA